MKKKKGSKVAIIFVILFAFIAIVAVISNSDTSSDSSSDTNNSNVSNTTETANTIIAENDYFTAEYIEASSISGVDGMFMISLKIKNTSNQSEIFLLEDVYIDDTKANFSGSGVPQTVLPDKNLNGVFSIAYPEKIENAKIIEFKIVCMDESYNKLITTRTITIKQ